MTLLEHVTEEAPVDDDDIHFVCCRQNRRSFCGTNVDDADDDAAMIEAHEEVCRICALVEEQIIENNGSCPFGGPCERVEFE